MPEFNRTVIKGLNPGVKVSQIEREYGKLENLIFSLLWPRVSTQESPLNAIFVAL